MSEKSLYFIINLDLATVRTESDPYELRTEKDFVFVLGLSGSASISIGHGDFFDLAQGMKIELEAYTRKEIEVINESQESKELVMLVGTRGKCQISI
ncbi:hypothetical protein ES705_22252 [subsurface metagenome]